MCSSEGPQARLIAQIFAIEEQQIEDVINQRDTSGAFEYLEELERRPAFLVHGGNFTIENNALASNSAGTVVPAPLLN
jgi:hypothetical protein